ncbi:MAG TPA: pilus assembly protein TadG-related protein, partial [Dehalococcoidia bacterium]|nr:pilus assembly protein TadG-related protein [Dehalococcoidia bacterium]
AAITMVVILGFAALTIDLGFSTHTKREAQNDADAMVLAGARDLPEEGTAESAANVWGTKNGVVIDDELQDITFGTTCSGAAVEDTITVRLKRNQKTFIAGVLGIQDADLNVCATARKGEAVMSNELMPFGFHHTDPYPGSNPDDVCYFYEEDGTTINPNLWDDPCVIKIPRLQDSWGDGNSGPVRLDEGGEPGNVDEDCNPGSSGSSEYSENILDGSECFYGEGDVIRPKTGNLRGPTCSAFVDDLLYNNSDSVEFVFGTPNAEGIYDVVYTESPRFALIPIVTASGSGSNADVTILGFITAYVESACGGPGCNGNGQNPACVIVRPMNAEIFIDGVDFAGGSGGFDVENALRTIKLVE